METEATAFTWIRKKGRTPTTYTGPHRDHTTGSGVLYCFHISLMLHSFFPFSLKCHCMKSVSRNWRKESTSRGGQLVPIEIPTVC